jgi:hypothetical protein
MAGGTAYPTLPYPVASSRGKCNMKLGALEILVIDRMGAARNDPAAVSPISKVRRCSRPLTASRRPLRAPRANAVPTERKVHPAYTRDETGPRLAARARSPEETT